MTGLNGQPKTVTIDLQEHDSQLNPLVVGLHVSYSTNTILDLLCRIFYIWQSGFYVGKTSQIDKFTGLHKQALYNTPQLRFGLRQGLENTMLQPTTYCQKYLFNWI